MNDRKKPDCRQEEDQVANHASVVSRTDVDEPNELGNIGLHKLAEYVWELLKEEVRITNERGGRSNRL